ncbi:MAG: glyoxalase/bleomycin resistance/dioxygenase family protein [Caulobacteraceae bacterium]|nr:glyoxalase/bleomycin resistance/dioxygenase family protein [Caulobacteraceae bacterium]
MAAQLTYAIKYVADMDLAVIFHRDRLGLPLKFQSPDWSEFATGQTTLALHIATPDKPAGMVELGFGVEDAEAFYARALGEGVVFTVSPTPMHGMKLGRFLDSEGCETSLSGP